MFTVLTRPASTSVFRELYIVVREKTGYCSDKARYMVSAEGWLGLDTRYLYTAILCWVGRIPCLDRIDVKSLSVK